jgi:hypothetical protein
MNTQVLEIYKQAHVPHKAIDPSNNMPYDTTIFSADKFAELLIRECAKIGEDTDGNWNVKHEILKNFGLK